MVLFKNQNVCKKNNFNIDNIKIKTYTEQAKIDLYEILNFRQELINAIKGLRDSEGAQSSYQERRMFARYCKFLLSK